MLSDCKMNRVQILLNWIFRPFRCGVYRQDIQYDDPHRATEAEPRPYSKVCNSRRPALDIKAENGQTLLEDTDGLDRYQFMWHLPVKPHERLRTCRTSL